jgi:EAL and modified HD-GYP domain-containing signal transduction protein
MAVIEDIFRQDPPLALKVFAYLNSALFARRYEVNSIRKAVILLGLTNLRRWVSLFAIGSLAVGRPPELFRACLVRARFCELVGGLSGLTRVEFDLFLVGLLSNISAILGRPTEELLDRLAVSVNVRAALSGDGGPLGHVFGLVQSYERGDWDSVAEASHRIGVNEEHIRQAYVQSLGWAAEASGAKPAGA